MEDRKVLSEFAARLNKAKIHYDNTKNQCSKLKAEANRLQKEYEQLVNNRKLAETQQGSLKTQYITSKKQNAEESFKVSVEMERLNTLRDQKKKLKREKEIRENELMKNTLLLEELVNEREELQIQAKQLSDRLECITSEKEQLRLELKKTTDGINEYTAKIVNLKSEISLVKDSINQNHMI